VAYLLVPERPRVAALIDELNEAASAAELPEPRGIIVLGSKGSCLLAALAAEGESVLLTSAAEISDS